MASRHAQITLNFAFDHRFSARFAGWNVNKLFRGVMKLSEKGRTLLKDLEGVKTTVYKDSSGFPTIGVGHLLTRDEIYSGKINLNGSYVKYGEGLLLSQVEQLLNNDLVRFERNVSTFVHAKLGANQFDAMVIFSFNIGVQAFNASTLLKMLNNNQFDAVPFQLRRWVYSAGEIVEGLKNRREKTIAHWLGESPPIEKKERGFDLCYKSRDKDYKVTITENMGSLQIELTGDWDMQ